MLGKFFERLKAQSQLASDKWDEYSSYYHRLEVPTKTVLLKEGEVSRKAYIIENGCLRVWFNNSGKDLTCRFAFENEIVSGAESFLKGIPSLFTVESIEPCALYWIHKRDLDKILEEIQEIPAFRKEYMSAVYDRQSHYMKLFLSFIRDTPAQRYQNLLKESPHIIQRVPQHYIASYLGITPVSLSRIRSKRKS
jgi:CRP-like cAMP-binding protein